MSSAGAPSILDSPATRARAALAAFVEEARSVHPAIAFDAVAFSDHVASHIPPAATSNEAALIRHLETMRGSDLLMAWGCARGDRAAISLFEQMCFGEIPHAMSRVRTRFSTDEVAQMMRERLFVRSKSGPPKAIQYAGGGDLRAWFRVVVTRHLLNLAQSSTAKEVELDQALLEILPIGDGTGEGEGPETAHVRKEYGPMLREAFLRALAELEPRSRTLLRLAVCDGLTVDAIASVYDVHRATAARWVVAAREELHASTKRHLRERLGQGLEESVTSLMRMLAERMEISIRAHLADVGEDVSSDGDG